MPLTRPPAPPAPIARPAIPAPIRAPVTPTATRGPAPPATRPGAPPPTDTVSAQTPRPVGRPPGSGVAQQAAQSQGSITEDGKLSNAIRSAQLRFYTAGAEYFESQMKGTVVAEKQARPSVSAPNAATVQTQAPTTPAAVGQATKPVGRPPGRPPASTPTQQVSVSVQPAAQASAQSTDLATMTRKDLVDMAKGMGIETQGVKGDDLRVLIANAGGAAPVAQEAETASEGETEKDLTANEQYMEVRATINMQLIDANLDKYEAYLDQNSTDPNALKCGGDCVRCPNPGKFPHAADQVARCYAELHADLVLEQQYPVEVAT